MPPTPCGQGLLPGKDRVPPFAYRFDMGIQRSHRVSGLGYWAIWCGSYCPPERRWYVADQEARELSADFISNIPSRTLEDDAMVNVRMDGGAVPPLWTSSVAVGSMHGLNIRLFGEKGGSRWAKKWPDQLYWTPLNGRTEILERGGPSISPEADRVSRIAIGHAEGMPLAFANIHADLAKVSCFRSEEGFGIFNSGRP